MTQTSADKAVEEAIGQLQQDIAAVEAERDEAIGLLRDIKKHTRLTDKDRMRFTSEFPEELYDRFHRFMKRHKEGS